jgi:competence protein ComEC
MKRPLVVAALALIGGILLADVSISHYWGIVFIILSILVMALLYRPIRKQVSPFVFLALPLFLTGYILHTINIQHHYFVARKWADQTVTLEGIVANQPESVEGKTRFTLAVKSVEAPQRMEPEGLNVRITLYTDEPAEGLEYGVLVRVSGELRLPQGRRNLGGFDTRRYLAAKEISAIMSEPASALTLLEGREAQWLKKTGYGIRAQILKVLNQCLPQEEASVLAGMLIGDTSQMPEEMEEDFRRAGLSHVMAVSGANIAFILMPLLGLLQKMGFNRRWASAISFPVMVFYVFATGMEASVIRAAIMAGVTLTGMILWRKADIFCAMAVSAILILLANSFMLFDPGFILSFAATLSLTVFYKPLFNKLPEKLPKSIRDTLAATLAAQIGVLPIIVYSFNTLSVISLFSNLIIVPLTGLITLSGALLALVGSFWLPFALMMGQGITWLIKGMLWLTRSLAGLPWAEINLATPSLMLIGLYYLVLLYLRYGHARLPRDIGRPLLAGIFALCGAVMVLVSLPDRSLRIYFADVGQGDCVLIRTPGQKNIIIDGGGGLNDAQGSYVGENIVVPLLYDLNMTQIDVMIATHGHSDHIGGLGSVLEAVPVRQLIHADAPDPGMNPLLHKARKMGVPTVMAREGDILLAEEGLNLQVIYPLLETWNMPQSATTSANEYSLVTKLDYGAFSALFTGDIGAETEGRILADGAMVDCDLMKIAHHGSRYSSAQRFIEATTPSLAIASVGVNRYGHPHPDVMNRLREQGVRVYDTLNFGGILVTVRGGSRHMAVTTTIAGR